MKPILAILQEIPICLARSNLSKSQRSMGKCVFNDWASMPEGTSDERWWCSHMVWLGYGVGPPPLSVEPGGSRCEHVYRGGQANESLSTLELYNLPPSWTKVLAYLTQGVNQLVCSFHWETETIIGIQSSTYDSTLPWEVTCLVVKSTEISKKSPNFKNPDNIP